MSAPVGGVTAVASKAAPGGAATRHMQAWLLLVGALALHVLDEALTGFLDFYNPLVESIRTRLPLFPMPTFTFDVWITGLIILVIVLAALAPAVRRGVTGTRFLSLLLAVVMLLNGLGHLLGSLYYDRWLPGATSAPLLLVASVLLMRATAARGAAARAT